MNKKLKLKKPILKRQENPSTNVTEEDTEKQEEFKVPQLKMSVSGHNDPSTELQNITSSAPPKITVTRQPPGSNLDIGTSTEAQTFSHCTGTTRTAQDIIQNATAQSVNLPENTHPCAPLSSTLNTIDHSFLAPQTMYLVNANSIRQLPYSLLPQTTVQISPSVTEAFVPPHPPPTIPNFIPFQPLDPTTLLLSSRPTQINTQQSPISGKQQSPFIIESPPLPQAQDSKPLTTFLPLQDTLSPACLIFLTESFVRLCHQKSLGDTDRDILITAGFLIIGLIALHYFSTAWAKEKIGSWRKISPTLLSSSIFCSFFSVTLIVLSVTSTKTECPEASSSAFTPLAKR